MAGVIVKIDFGDKSQVFERQYLDAMRAGSWTQWNTPKQYKSLDGTGRKLLLYDRTRQGVTVEVEIDRVECAEATSAYPWANVFAPATLRVLEPPIPLSVIRRVSGFQHFGLYRKDRSPYRNVTHEQYRELTAERSTEANATEPAAFPLPLAAESVP
jgi:hypothetical protein